MNKKVFIKQDGTIPGYRIIGELRRRGADNYYNYSADSLEHWCYYYIYDSQIRMWYLCDATPDYPLEGYTKLLYNKETDSFYESSPVLSNSPNTEKDLEQGEYNIPEGYEVKVEDGKVIVSKKKWKPKECEDYYYARYEESYHFQPKYDQWTEGDREVVLRYENDNVFKTKEDCQTFCDKLNNAVKSVLEERRKEVEK